jgi:hypothetical protein
MRTLQEWMGRSQLSTTEIYADYAPSAQEKAMVEQAFALPSQEETTRSRFGGREDSASGA